MQNKSNIYTINNAAPPSYAEATGTSALETHNPQFDQRYPHMVVYSPSMSFPYSYSPNCYLDRTPVQSAHPQYDLPEWQRQSTSTNYNRTLITKTKYEKPRALKTSVVGGSPAV
ncbi:PREDICTED: uncharacterized protein LOC105619438 [Atta cephalotes]|uniref:Uncharacterized protein n=1 Tax=Atta cephalotes TaxID=12957 RepID=A0A158NFN9_ATTCE|nr:PREDICTED: uncharacterized protein LOC105619438 [Atta cephalotes]